MEFLLFRLYGPLASWGEIAVGESRHSASYPSKSAILGLIGAALGIERQDAPSQQALLEGYTIAVEVHRRGNLLRDYHTTQAPDSAGKTVYRTRRDELVVGKSRLGTILSSREYRTDALAVVAVRTLADAPYSLEEIKSHLLKPKFHLYLGRKSCPLAAPLQPEIQQGKKDFKAAFAGYNHQPLQVQQNAYFDGNGDREYYWEGEQDDFSSDLDLTTMQTRVRHDQPLSRKRWQFTTRQEHYLYFKGGD